MLLGGTPHPCSSPEPDSTLAMAPAITDLEGRVLFGRAGGVYGDWTVFLIDADASDERQVGEVGASCCMWALRDGSLMIRTTYLPPDGPFEPTISAIDGSDARTFPVPEDLQFGAGPLSPDGSRVVLEGLSDTNGVGVYIANVDGSELEALTEEPLIPGDFSPDGREVLLWKLEQRVAHFRRPDRCGSWERMGSGPPAAIPPEGVAVPCCTNFHWSPDGTRIVFARPEGGLWTIGPEGTGLTEVFHDPDRWAITPTWSPDGSMIMFALDPSANPWVHPANSLYVIREDGLRPHPLLGRSGLQVGYRSGSSRCLMSAAAAGPRCRRPRPGSRSGPRSSSPARAAGPRRRSPASSPRSAGRFAASTCAGTGHRGGRGPCGRARGRTEGSGFGTVAPGSSAVPRSG